MKKNLRIVSAAAAALLAVAPVAATAIATPATTSVAQAATNYIEANSTSTTDPATDPATTSANILSSLTSGSTPVLGNKNVWKVSDLSVDSYTVTNKNGKKTVDQVVNYTLTYTGTKPASVDNTKAMNIAHKIKPETASDTEAKNFRLGDDGQVYHVGKNGQWYAVKGESQVKNATVLPAVAPATGVKEANKSFFATEKGNVLANDQNVPAGVTNSPKESYVNGNRVVYISDLKAAIEKVLGGSEFFAKEDSHTPVANSEAWNKYVFGEGNATSDANIISQLEHAGFTVSKGPKGNYFVPAAKQYTMVVRSNNGMYVNVTFENTNHIDMDKPVIVYRNSADEAWSPVELNNGNTVTSAIVVMQNDKGTFNPTDYLRAYENYNKPAFINATYSDNNVDTSKAGLYHITVSAKNAKGETTVANIPVVVTDRNGKKMTAANDADVFTKDASGKMVQANLANFQKFFKGTQVVVYGSPVTVDGTEYYHVLTANGNFYVKASDLQGYQAPAAAETTKTITIMHIAAIYDKNGKATNEPALRAYDTYSVVSEPVTIGSQKFYKMAGKDQYIKVGNVDGTKRTLKKNSYVYKNTLELKRNKHKKVTNKKLSAGSTVTTYGKSFMIKGHQVYRIGKNQYVKKANF